MKTVLWCIVGILILALIYWSLAFLAGILSYLLPFALVAGLVVLYFRYRAPGTEGRKTPGRIVERQKERAAGRELRDMERKIKVAPGRPGSEE